MSNYISVIVPIYNVEKYLTRCIDSILAQTYKNIEILLIDDGSTDSSGRIADEYAQKYKNIFVFHKKNGGLSSARNAGLDAAKGEYVCFVDSDDYIEADTLETYISMVLKEKVDIAICGCRVVRENKCDDKTEAEDKIELLQVDDIWQEVLGKLNNSACNKMYKIELIGDLRFPEGKLHGEDLIFNVQYLSRCGGGAINRAYKYNYIKRAGSITRAAFNQKMFDEVYVKDWVYTYVEKQRPDLIKVAMMHCFNSRMNMIRKIYQCNMSEEYSETINDYESFLEKHYSSVREIMASKRRAEYMLYRMCRPVWKVLISAK